MTDRITIEYTTADDGIHLQCDCGWNNCIGYSPTINEVNELAGEHVAVHMIEVVPTQLLGLMAATSLLRDRPDDVARIVREAIESFGRQVSAIVEDMTPPEVPEQSTDPLITRFGESRCQYRLPDQRQCALPHTHPERHMPIDWRSTPDPDTKVCDCGATSRHPIHARECARDVHTPNGATAQKAPDAD